MYYTYAFVVINIFETRVQENCPETYPEQATLAPVFCTLLEKKEKIENVFGMSSYHCYG